LEVEEFQKEIVKKVEEAEVKERIFSKWMYNYEHKKDHIL